jgi:hypothetical protein
MQPSGYSISGTFWRQGTGAAASTTRSVLTQPGSLVAHHPVAPNDKIGSTMRSATTASRPGARPRTIPAIGPEHDVRHDEPVGVDEADGP